MVTAWQRFNALMLVLVFLALLSLIAMVAMRAEGGPLDPLNPPGSTDSVRLPGTPIDAPTVISLPGHYYLTGDIKVGGAATGITIASSDVSLDMGGFMIVGDDAVGSVGISVPTGNQDVLVRNGLIRDVQYGLAADGNHGVFEGLRVTSSDRAFQITGTDNTLSDCAATDNLGEGIHATGFFLLVRGCEINFNYGDGITLIGSRSVVERSVFHGNNQDELILQASINVTGAYNIVHDNRIGRDALNEVYVTGTNNVFTDNVCSNAAFAMVGGNFAALTDHLNANCGSVPPP